MMLRPLFSAACSVNLLLQPELGRKGVWSLLQDSGGEWKRRVQGDLGGGGGGEYNYGRVYNKVATDV